MWASAPLSTPLPKKKCGKRPLSVLLPSWHRALTGRVVYQRRWMDRLLTMQATLLSCEMGFRWRGSLRVKNKNSLWDVYQLNVPDLFWWVCRVENDFLTPRKTLHGNSSFYRLLYILPASCVCFLRVKTTDIPKKRKWRHLGGGRWGWGFEVGGGGSPLSIIFLPLANVASSDSGGNNKTQCRETAPRLFPSVDKALAAAEWGERESFLHPWDRQRVRRSCALAAVTCPGATRKFPPQFPRLLLADCLPRADFHRAHNALCGRFKVDIQASRKCLQCDIIVCLWVWQECADGCLGFSLCSFFYSVEAIIWIAAMLRKCAAIWERNKVEYSSGRCSYSSGRAVNLCSPLPKGRSGFKTNI